MYPQFIWKSLKFSQLTEQLGQCQKELQMQVQDLDRLKKIYTDEETVAMDAREKANAAEEKWVRVFVNEVEIFL